VPQPFSNLPLREILREASVALEGRVVTLWRIEGQRQAVPLVSNDDGSADPSTAVDVLDTLLGWGVPIGEGSRWVGCRVEGAGRWCVARVRGYPPQPPPAGKERRGRERMVLELTGLCVGLLERAEHEQEARLA